MGNILTIATSKRKLTAVLACVLSLVGSSAQAAAVPFVATSSETMKVEQADKAVRGLIVPPTYLEEKTVSKADDKVVATYRISMTAYSSREQECDSTPFTTADGTHVRDGIVAANFLKIGTKVRIPAVFGDKVFEVRDRMNSRYTDRMDIWMDQTSKAVKFGLHQNVLIEVVS